MRCFGGDVVLLQTPNEREAIAVKTFDDGRVADLVPQMWGLVDLCITRPEDMHLQVYDNVWQYASVGTAIVGLIAWDGTGEPQGWIREPASGRRRPDGDPDREFIRE